MIASVFLPVGALGQGGTGIIQLGIVAQDAGYISSAFSNVLQAAGVLVGVVMWGYAIVWLVLAIVIIFSKFPRLNFSMAWWGFTFPLGTMTQSCTNNK